MGVDWVPLYGEMGLGSAIETAEKVIAKIKSNKYDDKDIVALESVLNIIKVSIERNEDKD